MRENIDSNLAGGVLHLLFNSADGLNTMDDTWFQTFESLLQQAADNRAVRVVLLSAQGSAFCAGANFLGMRSSVLHQYFTDSPLADLIKRLVSFPKPLIAAVHGKAIGGGATLLLHCDLVVAAADTQFRLPFTSLGTVPEFASSHLLPRAAGTKLANELLLLGNLFDAQKAQRAGLVNEIVPAGEQLVLAQQWATQLAALAPASVQTSKRLLHEAQHQSLSETIASEGAALVASFSSGEVQEAISAFLDKRHPDFSKFY